MDRAVGGVLDHVREEDSACAHLRDQVAQHPAQLVLVERGHSILAADARVAEGRCDDRNVPLLDRPDDERSVDLEAIGNGEDDERSLGHMLTRRVTRR